jgi:hypothetical protein
MRDIVPGGFRDYKESEAERIECSGSIGSSHNRLRFFVEPFNTPAAGTKRITSWTLKAAKTANRRGAAVVERGGLENR